jgi:hypothetical protein
MVDRKRSYDVFISHAVQDRALAEKLAAACRASGLDAVSVNDLGPGGKLDEALWEALAESTAVLAVLSGGDMTPNMGIELGAALAWNKPIFGMVSEATRANVPAGFRQMKLYPVNRIDDVIQAVKAVDSTLTEEDREALIQRYWELGIPTDQYATNWSALSQLATKFTESTKKHVSPERLLSELLRLRKSKRLRKITGQESQKSA